MPVIPPVLHRGRAAARRHVLPVVLLAVAVLAVVAAVAASPGAPAAAGGVPPGAAADPGHGQRPAVTTPVLSARRVPALVAGPLGRQRLATGVEAVAARAPDASCHVVSVDGAVVTAHHTDRPLVPASTQKLLTAAAVLHHVDPEERLRTTVRATGRQVDGTVADLWLVGGGDPLLDVGDDVDRFGRRPEVSTSLEALADAVVRAGVRRVTGRVVGDDSRYDAQRYVATWKPGYIAQHQTGPLSALTVNDGFSSPRVPLVPFPEPATGAAAVLADLLRARGVAVTGPATAGVAPVDAEEVAAVESATMARLVGQMLSESDNGTAELLLKELGLRVGGSGSTAEGVRVVADTMAALGLPVEGLTVLDGSGLDRENRVTCHLLHDLLARQPADSPLLAGLAVAGERGTLTGRFLDTPAVGRLRGKTGSINGVSTLAGVVRGPDGSRIVFAQMLNDVGPAAGRQLQDALASVLAGFPDVPALEQLAPVGHPPRRPATLSAATPAEAASEEAAA